MPPLQTNFTATSGDKAVLHCPIQPGMLLLQYSVMWKKGYTAIAKVANPQDHLDSTDARYQIDRGKYSLIINSATINDTSTDYKCELTVTNPLTNSKQVLQPSPPVTLSLEVIGELNSSNDNIISLLRLEIWTLRKNEEYSRRYRKDDGV